MRQPSFTLITRRCFYCGIGCCMGALAKMSSFFESADSVKGSFDAASNLSLASLTVPMEHEPSLAVRGATWIGAATIGAGIGYATRRPAALAAAVETAASGAEALLDDGARDGGLVEKVIAATNRRLAPEGGSFLPLGSAGPDAQIHYYQLSESLAGSRLAGWRPGNLKLLTESQFRDAVRAFAKESKDGGIAVFIPGMRNAPGEAFADGVDLSRNLGKPVVVEDWVTNLPSALHKVHHDYRAADQSLPFIARNIGRVQRDITGDVDLVAHSLGSRIQLGALGVLGRVGGPVSTAVFVNPDVTVDGFTEAFSAAKLGARRMVLVTDQRGDLALLLSQLRSSVLSQRLEQSLGRIGLDHSGLRAALQDTAPDYLTWRSRMAGGLFRHSFSGSDVTIASVLNDSKSVLKR